jgi:phosphoribosylaminoimidazole-succinocarboxamide synthase
MSLIKSGKVKDVYAINDKELEFEFSNRISVFDKIIPSDIPNKGETLARTSAYWFELIQKLGISTHYLGLTTPNRIRVKRVNVISDYSLLTSTTVNYLIPLECIFEVTTKLEKTDRILSTKAALQISGLTLTEYSSIKDMSLKIDKIIEANIKHGNLIHVDGKKEFAFDEDRNLMVVDTFGTADEDRFWDAKDFADGRNVERSKEFVRQYYRKIGYYAKLMKARKNATEEPPIPPLPNTIIQRVSQIYIDLFEDLTGQKFR